MAMFYIQGIVSDAYTYKAEQAGVYKDTFSSEYKTYYVNTVSDEKKKLKTGRLNVSLGVATGYVEVSVNALTEGRYAYLSITSGSKTLPLMADFD